MGCKFTQIFLLFGTFQLQFYHIYMYFGFFQLSLHCGGLTPKESCHPQMVRHTVISTPCHTLKLIGHQPVYHHNTEPICL